MVDRTDRIDAILYAAIELSTPEERADYLRAKCGGDDELLACAEALLEAHFRAGSFLERPVTSLAPEADLHMAEQSGTTIGRYKLLEPIGEGGFAVVFMAEQQQPVRRRVAVKVIKPGMDSRQVNARFEAERQALAMMEHSNIAKVLDAGTTESGRPYFVMELVKGTPITDYCDDHRLSIEQRLGVFTQVCSAVQHAHQKGIVHRDIKPSNVLVRTENDTPLVKVIDFGIAKATETPLTDRTLFTDFRQLIGTPSYMSPEQAEGSLDIDTRSDVYSLGVLLYELLAGATPFDPKELRSKTLAEMQRIIREVEPPTPSARLSTLNYDARTLKASQRQLDPKRPIQRAHRELDWIVMRAMEKDRGRRYQSSIALADDIRRFLTNEPVEARPATRIYRFCKFARRNRGLLCALGVVVVTLATATVVSTWQAIRADRAAQEARHQERIASREAFRSEQVAKLLTQMLEGAGPSVARGRDATLLREIMESTAERLESSLSDEPEIQGDLWYTLGDTFRDIGDMRRAAAMFEQASRAFRNSLGNENVKLAKALASLGACQSFLANVEKGKATTQMAVDIARKCNDRKVLAQALLARAMACNAYGKCSEEGMPFALEAVELRREIGDNQVSLASGLNYLAGCPNFETGKRLDFARESLALMEQHLGAEHPTSAYAKFMLGQLLIRVRRFDEAEPVLRETFDLWQKFYPADHPYRSIVFRCLAASLLKQGKNEVAEALARQEVDRYPEWAHYWQYLGWVHCCQREWPEAEVALAKSVELYPVDYDASREYAMVLYELGKQEQLVAHVRSVLDRFGGEEKSHRPGAVVRLALLLPNSDAAFRRACEIADARAGRHPKELWDGQPVKAMAEYRRERFDSALIWSDRTIADSDVDKASVASAWFIRAAALARLDRTESARAALAEGEEVIREVEADTRADLPSLYDWGEWQLADILRRHAEAILESPDADQAK